MISLFCADSTVDVLNQTICCKQFGFLSTIKPLGAFLASMRMILAYLVYHFARRIPFRSITLPFRQTLYYFHLYVVFCSISPIFVSFRQFKSISYFSVTREKKREKLLFNSAIWCHNLTNHILASSILSSIMLSA